MIEAKTDKKMKNQTSGAKRKGIILQKVEHKFVEDVIEGAKMKAFWGFKIVCKLQVAVGMFSLGKKIVIQAKIIVKGSPVSDKAENNQSNANEYVFVQWHGVLIGSFSGIILNVSGELVNQ